MSNHSIENAIHKKQFILIKGIALCANSWIDIGMVFGIFFIFVNQSHQFMRKFLLPFFFVFFFQTVNSHAQDVFLKGKYVQIGVHPAASFGSSNAAPSGYHANVSGRKLGFICDIQKDGWNSGTPNFMGDYFVPGSPEEGWGLEWSKNPNGTGRSEFYNFGLMNLHDVSTVSHQKYKTTGREQSQWIGNATNGAESALVYQTVSLDSLAQYFTINVLIKNTGADTLYNLSYFRNVDPDNEQPITGSYGTFNYIQHQPGWNGNADKAAVVAYGSVYKSPCILGAIDSRAHVSVGGFSIRNVNDIFKFSDSTMNEANPHFADEAISLAFDLGPLPPGECITFAYYYALQNINPEDISFPVNTHFDISDDGFTTSQSFIGGNLCVRDTVLNFAVKTEGMGSSFIDKVLWDADLDGVYELEGDTVEITFPGWKKHKFAQKIVFCDGTKADSIYEIFIEPKPVIKFEAISESQCFKEHEFEFENTSFWIKDSIQKFTWKFEGGENFIGSKPNPYKFDSFASNKWIRLVAETTIGCVDSSQIQINLFPNPNIEFKIHDSAQCLSGNLFTGIVNSNIVSGSLRKEVIWGNSIVDTFENPTHTFTEHGEFDIVARVISDMGCSANDTQSVFVYAQPMASFVANDSSQCFNKHDFIFSNNSHVADGALQYKWTSSLGSAGTKDYRLKFPNPGSQKIKLEVESEKGCKDSTEKTIQIQPQPLAGLEVNETGQCLKGNEFVFSNTSVLQEKDRSIWISPDLNRIDTMFDESWKIKFNREGNYQVTLILENAFSCRDTAETRVEVYPQNELQISGQLNGQCLLGNNFDLTSSSTNSVGPLTYKWQASEDQNFGNETNWNLRFTSPGNKEVLLTTETDRGCLDSATVLLKVWEMPKFNWDIRVNDSCYNSQNIQHVFTSTNVERSTWYLNAKNLGTEIPLNTKYANEDRLLLITETLNGCRDSVTKNIQIFNNPIASFSATSKVCLGSELAIENTSKTLGLPTTFNWFVNDEESQALDVNPIILKDIDKFKIGLKAQNNYGCVHDTTIEIEVVAKSFVELNIAKAKRCANDNYFELNAISTNPNIPAVNNKWIWNDGLSQNGDRVLRRGLQSGDHQVKLITQNSMGCFDTLQAQISVLPSIQMGASTNSVCFPESNLFISNSTAINDRIKRNIWQVAGQEFYGDNIRYFLKIPGEYDVKHMVETENGCRDTLVLSKQAILRNKPRAAFELDSFFSDGLGMNLTLKNKSSKDVDQWGWSFNDWEYSADENPSFLFTDTGLVEMTLIVGNTAGCYDTLIQKMGPYFPMFYLHIPNAFTPNEDDLNQNFKPFITPYLMKYSFEIYNRYGELMFKTNNPNDAWDGTFNDEPVQEGVYVYIMYATDLMGDFYKEKGDVTLFRNK